MSPVETRRRDASAPRRTGQFSTTGARISRFFRQNLQNIQNYADLNSVNSVNSVSLREFSVFALFAPLRESIRFLFVIFVCSVAEVWASQSSTLRNRRGRGLNKKTSLAAGFSVPRSARWIRNPIYQVQGRVTDAWQRPANSCRPDSRPAAHWWPVPD